MAAPASKPKNTPKKEIPVGRIFYVGPGPDGLVVDGHTFVRDGDGVDIDDEKLAKALLSRDDFQSSKPTRQEPKVETPKDKES